MSTAESETLEPIVASFPSPEFATGMSAIRHTMHLALKMADLESDYTATVNGSLGPFHRHKEGSCGGRNRCCGR